MNPRQIIKCLVVLFVLECAVPVDWDVKAANSLIGKLRYVPGIKPHYTPRFDIEKILQNEHNKPLLHNDFGLNILSKFDSRRYRAIFRIQREGNWRIADRLIGTIKDPILMGHVLAQRYLHPTKYRTNYKEFKAWLEKYNDHPEARRIYRLALKRRPKNWKMPKKPKKIVVSQGIRVRTFQQTKSLGGKRLTRSQLREVRRFKSQIRQYSRKGWTLALKNLIGKKRLRDLFTSFELDRARASLAAGYYAAGRDKWALNWAEKALKNSGHLLPEAYWTAGLASWRLGQYLKSRAKFEGVIKSKESSSWLISAGAFWAARASIKILKPQEFTRYLEVAANYPRTFYGMLAGQLLGRNFKYNWTSPPMAKNAFSQLASEPGGRRVMSLIQVGEVRLAEKGLERLLPDKKKVLMEAMLAIVDRANMASLAIRLGNALAASGSKIYDSVIYPSPPLEFAGKEADRELILAIVRQESGFNTRARSPRGARGLMQLMPSTASFVAKDRSYRGSRRKALFDPKINLVLGQRYLNMLLQDKKIKGNLFYLLVAWNGGPGNLNKWLRQIDFNNDPLLFIESIPLKETRIYVERVITNYWMYLHRSGKYPHTLDQVVAGDWPLYRSKRRIADKSELR